MVKKICLFAMLFVVLSNGVYAMPNDDKGMRFESEEVREKLKDMRAKKLTEMLKLDEQTSNKLIPVVNKYDEKRYSLKKEMTTDMRQLKQSINKSTDEELSALISKIRNNKTLLPKLEDEEFEKIKGILTTKQQAEYILFKAKFAKEVRKRLSEMKKSEGAVKN